MMKSRRHATHPDLIKRLKRADGHLRHVVGLIEDGRRRAKIAVRLQPVEIDHCPGTGGDADPAEIEALAELL